MIPFAATAVMTWQGIPRESGDDPPSTLGRSPATSYSPRERG